MNKKYTYLIIIFLIAASLAAFGRIAGHDFINYDDNKYITENYQIRSGVNLQSIKWAFGTVEESNWHPLTWISHMIDWNLFGANASGHHIVSLVFHIGAVVLLFLFLSRITNNIWPAAFAAAFFALHPLRVESVAWAAERKDVLSMLFGMASLYAYSFYTETKKLSHYLICLMLFSCALMSKPMFVTLPCLLMLLDYWPLKRWQNITKVRAENRFKQAGRLIGEKIPFICIMITSIVITYWVQKKGNAVTSIEILPLPERFTNGVLSYALYLGKVFCPLDLAIFYPYKLSLPVWQILVSAIIIAVITFAVIYLIRTMPFLFTGWFWYLGTLVPVIGLVQVGGQAMADRYTYLPSIGISIMIAWGIPPMLKRAGVRKNVLFSISIAVLCLLVFLTWMQSGYWKNSITLFNHAVRVTKGNYIAHNNLGVAMSAEGMIKEAIDHYNKAIIIKPNNANAYNNRGNAYSKRGMYDDAIQDYKMAIRIKPDYAEAYNNYAGVFLLQGNTDIGCNYARKSCAMGVCKALKKAENNGSCY
ncbi:MAG: tetratricopeptide repeat protein [Smithella sp.]